MLLWAYPELQLAEQANSQIEFIEKIPEFQVNKPVTINLDQVIKNENAIDVKILITLDRGLVFAGDEINYHARSISTNSSNVLGIALLFDHKVMDYSKYSTQQMYNEVEKARPFRQVIEMIPDSETPFNTEGVIPFPVEQDVYVQGVVFTKDNRFQLLELKESVFKVYPLSSKLELETNRVLLAQAEEQRKATQSQEVSNHRIIGLTWVGIGAIPILVCADMLIRIHLREKVVERWYENKDMKDHSKFYR